MGKHNMCLCENIESNVMDNNEDTKDVQEAYECIIGYTNSFVTNNVIMCYDMCKCLEMGIYEKVIEMSKGFGYLFIKTASVEDVLLLLNASDKSQLSAGFENAIIGYTNIDGGDKIRVCYYIPSMIQILIKDTDMDVNDAVEHLKSNFLNVYSGEYTPIYMDAFGDICDE